MSIGKSVFYCNLAITFTVHSLLLQKYALLLLPKVFCQWRICADHAANYHTARINALTSNNEWIYRVSQKKRNGGMTMSPSYHFASGKCQMYISIIMSDNEPRFCRREWNVPRLIKFGWVILISYVYHSVIEIRHTIYNNLRWIFEYGSRAKNFRRLTWQSIRPPVKAALFSLFLVVAW